MQRHRPTSVFVVAILNIIFGSLCSVGGLCGLGSQGMNSAGGFPQQKGAAAAPDPNLEIEKDFPMYKTYTLITTVVGLIASVALLASGIGLLSMQPWARGVTLGYAAYLVIAAFAGVIVSLLFVYPAMKRWEVEFTRQMGGGRGGPPAGFVSMIMIGTTFGIALIQIVYAVALVMIMARPNVTAAFAGELPPPDNFDEQRFRS